jgi:TetR/AcrR family transcriptional repressor of nem operon
MSGTREDVSRRRAYSAGGTRRIPAGGGTSGGIERLGVKNSWTHIPTGWYEKSKEDTMVQTGEKPTAREKILTAALTLIRTKGYAGTTVDDLCASAGVTKGAFFHHFRSKDDLAVAAADFWSEMTGRLFAGADYHDHADPLDRVLGYIDFRKSLLRGAVPEFTCLVGTMVQETYDTRPAVRDACERSIREHAATVEADIAEAMRARGIVADWTAESLALHTQAVLQGAFILAKAKGEAPAAADAIHHLRRYVTLLFSQTNQRSENHAFHGHRQSEP